MLENSFAKHNNKSDNEKQINITNIFKANESFFKETKRGKKMRFTRRSFLKTVNPPKINLSDSILNFSDSTWFNNNEKSNPPLNSFRLKGNKFKTIKPEIEESLNNSWSNSISKWQSELAPIRGHEAKILAKNPELKKEKKVNKVVLEPTEPINHLMDEREKTDFSIKIAYDNLFANRLDAITPHTYLDLDIDPQLALARENTIKNMNNLFGLSRQKTHLSPEIYHTIQRPKQNLYTELVPLNNANKKNLRKYTAPKTTIIKKKINIKQSTKMENQASNGYESFDKIESSIFLDIGNDIRSISLREAHNLADLADIQSSNSTYCEEKKPYQPSPESKILDDLANIVKFKEALKETPFSNKKSPIKHIKKTFIKTNKKASIKEFKYCIMTDLKIGEGEFSETFQGYRYDMGAPIKIAAKRLKMSKEKNEQNVENLLSEISVLNQLGKNNFVIDFLGVFYHMETMYLIFEFAEKGDLKRLLDLCRKSSRREIIMNSLYKIRIAYEIASGMEYISNLNIVHKDLAARNVLLDKDYTCKIADFGFCKTEFLTKMPSNL